MSSIFNPVEKCHPDWAGEGSENEAPHKIPGIILCRGNNIIRGKKDQPYFESLFYSKLGSDYSKSQYTILFVKSRVIDVLISIT